MALREERGSTTAVVSPFIQRPVSCFEDRCSAERQVIGQARRAGADCDALCVLRMLPHAGHRKSCNALRRSIQQPQQHGVCAESHVHHDGSQFQQYNAVT